MSRAATQRKPAESFFSRRILVEIKRDITQTTPVVIWQHEFPILQELHEDSLKEIDVATMDEGYTPKFRGDMLAYNKTMETVPRPSESAGLGFVFIGNADVEWQRLRDLYGRHPKENVLLVERIYGRPQEGKLARAIGEPHLMDLPQKQLVQLVLDYGYAPEPHKDMPEAEKSAAHKLRAGVHELSVVDLVSVAESLGVQIG